MNKILNIIIFLIVFIVTSQSFSNTLITNNSFNSISFKKSSLIEFIKDYEVTARHKNLLSAYFSELDKYLSTSQHYKALETTEKIKEVIHNVDERVWPTEFYGILINISLLQANLFTLRGDYERALEPLKRIVEFYDLSGVMTDSKNKIYYLSPLSIMGIIYLATDNKEEALIIYNKINKIIIELGGNLERISNRNDLPTDYDVFPKGFKECIVK